MGVKVWLLAVVIASGCDTQSEKKENHQLKVTEERQDSPEALDCRGKKKFWDPLGKTCMEDIALAEFACTTAELDSRVHAISKALLTVNRMNGYMPLSCGIKS